jgi:hypothetical protein
MVKETAKKKKATARKSSGPVARRDDYDAPILGYVQKQPPALRAVLETMQKLVVEAAPEARAALKWGHPAFTIEGSIMCALQAHKGHVNVVLSGPAGTYADTDGLLEGKGSTGCHLKARSVDDLPREKMRAWLRVAANRARGT